MPLALSEVDGFFPSLLRAFAFVFVVAAKGIVVHRVGADRTRRCQQTLPDLSSVYTLIATGGIPFTPEKEHVDGETSRIRR